MNIPGINIVRLRGVERELARLNANIELLLYHVYNVVPDAYVPHDKRGSGVEADVLYTDEAEDALREQLELTGRIKKLEEEEAERESGG